jgi:hypothetical protein
MKTPIWLKQNTSKLKATVALCIPLALTACPSSSGNQASAPAPVGPRTALASTLSASGMQLVGTVSSDAPHQAQFQAAVVGFLSTDLSPSYIGTVNVSPSSTSGVFFGGQVTLSTGSMKSYTGQNATISPTSQFAIQVIDSNPSVPNTPAIPAFVFQKAAGTLQGMTAQLQFSDTYGTITMAGTVDTTKNLFTGTMAFDNNVLYDGSTPGHAGNLGNFSIPLCQFFVCN